MSTSFSPFPSALGSGIDGSRFVAEGVAECPICLSLLHRDVVAPSCGHTFHHDCLSEWLVRQVSCPMCKKRVNGVKTIPWDVQTAFAMLQEECKSRDMSSTLNDMESRAKKRSVFITGREKLKAKELELSQKLSALESTTARHRTLTEEAKAHTAEMTARVRDLQRSIEQKKQKARSHTHTSSFLRKRYIPLFKVLCAGVRDAASRTDMLLELVWGLAVSQLRTASWGLVALSAVDSNTQQHTSNSCTEPHNSRTNLGENTSEVKRVRNLWSGQVRSALYALYLLSLANAFQDPQTPKEAQTRAKPRTEASLVRRRMILNVVNAYLKRAQFQWSDWIPRVRSEVDGIVRKVSLSAMDSEVTVTRLRNAVKRLRARIRGSEPGGKTDKLPRKRRQRDELLRKVSSGARQSRLGTHIPTPRVFTDTGDLAVKESECTLAQRDLLARKMAAGSKLMTKTQKHNTKRPPTSSSLALSAATSNGLTPSEQLVIARRERQRAMAIRDRHSWAKSVPNLGSGARGRANSDFNYLAGLLQGRKRGRKRGSRGRGRRGRR